MTSDGRPPITPETAAPLPQDLKTTWLAVDANPHQIRLVVVEDGHIRGAFEATAGPRQVQRTLHFVRKTVLQNRNVKLTGRFYDRWPPLLHAALVQEFGPVTWINPNLLTTTRPGVVRWHRMFKSYRAPFFAICADAGLNESILPDFDRSELLHRWKSAVIYDLMADVQPQAVEDVNPTDLL